MRTTALVVALLVPALLGAQADSSQRTGARNQSRAGQAGDSTGRARGRNGMSRYQNSSNGGVASRGSMGRSMGLSSDQIRQLQTALQNDGCDPGTPDGVMGPRTRRALACARQKHNLTGNDTNELLRAEGLDFTVSDSAGMGTMNRSGRRGGSSRGSQRDASDSTMSRGDSGSMGNMTHGQRGMARGRQGRDSTGANGGTRNRTTRPDSTARPRP